MIVVLFLITDWCHCVHQQHKTDSEDQTTCPHNDGIWPKYVHPTVQTCHHTHTGWCKVTNESYKTKWIIRLCVCLFYFHWFCVRLHRVQFGPVPHLILQWNICSESTPVLLAGDALTLGNTSDMMKNHSHTLKHTLVSFKDLEDLAIESWKSFKHLCKPFSPLRTLMVHVESAASTSVHLFTHRAKGNYQAALKIPVSADAEWPPIGQHNAAQKPNKELL